MSGKEYVLAYDLGTSSVKAALVDMKGRAADITSVEYPLYIPRPGWAEQDPESYWNAVCEATHRILANTGVASDTVRGLSFGTQWKGIIPVSSDGKVLRRAIIWLDNRADDQSQRMNLHYGRQLFGGQAYWAKLMWVAENEPEVVENAEKILEVNGFLKWKATGDYTVDLGNCYTGSFDPGLDVKYKDILDLIRIPHEKFPRLIQSTDPAGLLTEEAAGEMGLPKGLPVFGGNTDIQAIATGAGRAGLGGVHAYFGSSGWVGFTVPHDSKDMFRAHLTQDRDLLLYEMPAIGLSFDWAVKTLYEKEYEKLGTGVYDLIDRELADVPPGSAGALAAPWFYGDVPPLFGTKVKGTFMNLQPHYKRAHLTSAIMEGVCYQLRMGTEYTGKKNRLPWPDSINVIGGGTSNGRWMQMLADIMRIPVCIPESRKHAGAVGTAYSALIGLGVCGDYADAARLVRISQSYEPIVEHLEVYEKQFSLFEMIYQQLEPIFESTADRKVGEDE